jgi:hypothetical protein
VDYKQQNMQPKNTTMKYVNIILLVLTMPAPSVWAQIAVPFTSDQWKFETKDYRLETYNGKPAVWAKGNRLTLPSAVFENGIIEYDVAFPHSRGFIGVGFRMQDQENYERFYLRPHQSGNPDACQYTPVYNGSEAWQLYHGEGYGVPIPYTFDAWIHIKLVVSGQYMEVFVNDIDNPVLFSELKRPAMKGSFALDASGPGNHFANFVYTPLETVPLKGSPKPTPSAPAGTITHWQVSSPFAEKILANQVSLKGVDVKTLDWKKMVAENTGTVNLAMTAKQTQEVNTVLAKFVIDSERDQVKTMQFGFSDKARVFLNGTILYTGEDAYRSRDYRFLGTIGYFDAVHLYLRKGRNEICVAVSENFGGWGIKAKFEDPAGIRLED